MPKITVLMSVYNGERYLRKAIESTLNQTFKDFEFIIIDDASTDSTKNIILSYKDPRIRFVENKKNLGLTRSLNKGLKIAKGEYIARIDADDIPIKSWLEEKLDFMMKHPDVAVVGNWLKIIDREFGETYIVDYEHDSVIIKWKHLIKNQIAHSSSLFRKKVIEEVGCYNEKYRYTQDFDLWFRVSRKYKMTSIPKVLATIMRHNKCVSKIPKTHRIQEQFVSEIIFSNVNYYINLNQKDLKIFVNAVKRAKISSFKDLIKARKIYKDLFNSYIKKEKLSKEDIKKILSDYKGKQKSMFIWYIKCKFPKLYNLCRRFK